LASATSSCTDFTGKDGLTSSMCGWLATRATGVKSFTGSQSSLEYIAGWLANELGVIRNV
jgi:hypothetical protein